MEHIKNALTQIEEEMEKLTQIKTLLLASSDADLVHFYATCQERNIKLHHYFSDNREFLRGIKDYLNKRVEQTGFSFSMQENHLNSDKLMIIHHKLGTVGEVSLRKNSVWIWKNPFNGLIRNQHDLERLEAKIPKDEEKMSRYELDFTRYQNYPDFMKKLRGITPSKFEKMEKFLEAEKQNLQHAMNQRQILRESARQDWENLLLLIHEFKQFLSIMKSFDFTHDFHAFDEKKTYFMRYRQNKHSHLSGILTYEEGHLSFIHPGEFEVEASDPQLKLFRYTEEEFQYLLETIREHFSHAKREWVGDSDVISIENEAEQQYFAITKEGFIIVHGEDATLYHLLRFADIRKAMCLLYKERTHEDNLKAIKGV